MKQRICFTTKNHHKQVFWSMIWSFYKITPTDAINSQWLFHGKKKGNTTLRQAKTGKHECRNIAAAYDTTIRQAKTGKHECRNVIKCENYWYQLSRKVLKLNFYLIFTHNNFFTWKFPGIFQNFLPKKPDLFPGINQGFSTLCNSNPWR